MCFVCTTKIKSKAKIRNRYNQVPHMTRNTILRDFKNATLYIHCFFSTILIQKCFLYHFLFPDIMDHYLPKLRFAHAVHPDVTLTLVFFNNCRLTNVSVIKFEIKHFEQVASCLNQWKNKNGFGNNHLITLPGAAFLCLRLQIISLIFQTAITGG